MNINVISKNKIFEEHLEKNFLNGSKQNISKILYSPSNLRLNEKTYPSDCPNRCSSKLTSTDEYSIHKIKSPQNVFSREELVDQHLPSQEAIEKYLNSKDVANKVFEKEKKRITTMMLSINFIFSMIALILSTELVIILVLLVPIFFISLCLYLRDKILKQKNNYSNDLWDELQSKLLKLGQNQKHVETLISKSFLEK